MSSDRSPRVFLLRSGSEPDPYVDAFARAGIEAVCEPVLAFSFANPKALHKRLQQPAAYGGLICTSPRAVQVLGEVLAEEGDADAWRAKTAYAVGPKTAAELRALGFTPEGEASGSAAALAAVIARQQQLLFLCGNRRRDTLPNALTEAGIPFEELVVYETRTRHDVTLPERRDGDWLAFFSPSGTEAIAAAPRVEPSGYRKAAIGPTTAAALAERGWAAEAVAEDPTPEALVQAVRDAIRRPER